MKEKVAVQRCNSYDLEKVRVSLDKAIEAVGGFETYIKPGETIFLKANLLMNKKPEEATTTHPIFVEALAMNLVDFGCQVIIGDSPGGPFNEKMLRRIYKGTGIDYLGKKEHVSLNYNVNSCKVTNERGKLLKSLTMTEMIKSVDHVFSVCKLKTHGMMTYTGAVKNMFGTIPGTLKAEFHFRMPELNDFADALIDICLAANPTLSFMDGVVAMEGDGPSAGTPREVGAILVSKNPYELDVVAASIIGLKAETVPTIKQSIERELCSKEINEVQIIGDNIESFKQDNFKLPKHMSSTFIGEKAPKFIKDIVFKLTQPKPVFIHDKCIGCRDCANNCPAEVIVMKQHKPYVNLDGCIRCYCCQELCPEKAVEIRQTKVMSWLNKL